MIVSGSVTTVVSKATLPLSSTTQIAVSSMPTSSPEKNSIARLPRCRDETGGGAIAPFDGRGAGFPPPCRLRAAFLIGRAKSTPCYAFLRFLQTSSAPYLAASIASSVRHQRGRDLHSPGGVHAFLRVQHCGCRMLFIRFVNRAVQAVRRSHPEGRKQARDSGHSPFRGPARGRSPRARISNLAPSQHAGCNTSANPS